MRLIGAPPWMHAPAAPPPRTPGRPARARGRRPGDRRGRRGGGGRRGSGRRSCEQIPQRLAFAPRPVAVLLMLLHVIAEMASVTHGFQVCLVLACRVLAEMRHRQHHRPLGPFRGGLIDLFAPARPRVRPMQPTFAHALTPPLRAPMPDLVAERLPVAGIDARFPTHGPSLLMLRAVARATMP